MSGRLSRRGLRHPWRRARPHLPAPRERDRAVALRPRHRGDGQCTGCTTASCRSKGEKMSKSRGQFRHDPRIAGDGEVRRPEMAGRGAAAGDADDALSRADRFFACASWRRRRTLLRKWEAGFAADRGDRMAIRSASAGGAALVRRPESRAISPPHARVAGADAACRRCDGSDARPQLSACRCGTRCVPRIRRRRRTDSVDEGDVVSAIAKRLAFIAAKNWAEADRIRDELLAQGIQLKDGKDPATGERVTTWEVKR